MRNAAGDSRATLEVDGYIRQIKGPRNGAVPPDAVAATIEAIESLGFDASERDMENIGYVSTLEPWMKKFLDYTVVRLGSKDFIFKQSLRLKPKLTARSGRVDLNSAMEWLFSESVPTVETVSRLLEKGADPKGPNANLFKPGFSSYPLVACERKDWELAFSLISKGAPSNVGTGKYGYTPIHWAAWHDRSDLIPKFKEVGADIDSAGNHGAPPIQMAIRLGKLDAAAELLKMGAQVNFRDTSGVTLLHDLCTSPNKTDQEQIMALAESLISRGLSPSEKHQYGKTPRDEAAKAVNGKLFLLPIFDRAKEPKAEA